MHIQVLLSDPDPDNALVPSIAGLLKMDKTKHDAAVGSHSIDQGAARHLRGVKKGDLDLMRVQEWVGTLLEERGSDLYRMKGVLAIAHAKQKFVFQAIHMLFANSQEGPLAAPNQPNL